ncbi:MAG: branched chain amino acid aminotransferase, partial [Lentilactobacillus parabuchneri]|nr:branched chain amino acid aminotransferase [Lentilactobacillus parabuchneri]
MAKAQPASEIDWTNLGFDYMDLPYRFLAHYQDGKWDNGELTEDGTL